MQAIVECVPNFSEGRDLTVISTIGDAIRTVHGVTLLSAEPDKDYNRTVVTFVGTPQAVCDAAFEATRAAARFIDMRFHRGEHPRLGAADVVPFVPVSGVSMAECVELARRFGRRVGEELHIPVYLYEEAATRPERRNLATIRKGEYEGLIEKLADPKWKPDEGPDVFNPKTGATVTGARSACRCGHRSRHPGSQILQEDPGAHWHPPFCPGRNLRRFECHPGFWHRFLPIHTVISCTNPGNPLGFLDPWDVSLWARVSTRVVIETD